MSLPDPGRRGASGYVWIGIRHFSYGYKGSLRYYSKTWKSHLDTLRLGRRIRLQAEKKERGMTKTWEDWLSAYPLASLPPIAPDSYNQKDETNATRSRSDHCGGGVRRKTMETPMRQKHRVDNYSQSSSLSSSALRPSLGLLGALLGTPDAAPTMS